MSETISNSAKTSSALYNNIKLHDLAETCGKDLLIQWGFKFSPFSENKNYRKFWEGKKERPDIVVEYKDKKAFINWNGKRRPVWLIDKHAVSSYEKWKDKLHYPLLVCFAIFDRNDYFQDIRFAVAGVHNYLPCKRKMRDANEVVEFESDLPEFTKADVLNYLS